MKEFQTSADLIENYRQVRERMRGRPKPVRPPPRPEPPVAVVEVAQPPGPPDVSAQPYLNAVRIAAAYVVEEQFGITRQMLESQSRYQRIVEARRAFVWLVRTHAPEASRRRIGTWLGKRDHSSIWHLHNSCERLIAADGEHALMMMRLFQQVTKIMKDGGYGS